MNEEEIKKIAREYAEDVFKEQKERNINHLTDEEWELSIDEVAKDTIDAFQWLCKDYFIVPKDRVEKLAERCESIISVGEQIGSDVYIAKMQECKRIIEHLFDVKIVKEKL